jgi:hypothetical protein
MAVILGLDIGTSKLAALAWRSDTRQVLPFAPPQVWKKAGDVAD